MKTNIKLVAGSIAGILSLLGLVVGGLVWAARSGPQELSAEAAEPAPLPIAGLHRELATIHRADSTEPAPSAAASPAVAEVPRPDVHVSEPNPFEAQLSSGGAVRVRRLVLSSGVHAHEPTGAADEFELGAQGRIYAFVDAVNDSGEDASLTVTFEPESGETSGHVSLDVPANSPRYRTWAWTRHVYTTGRWQVVVRASDGRVVARRAFDVVR